MKTTLDRGHPYKKTRQKKFGQKFPLGGNIAMKMPMSNPMDGKTIPGKHGLLLRRLRVLCHTVPGMIEQVAVGSSVRR